MTGLSGYITHDVKQTEMEPREIDLEILENNFVGLAFLWEDPVDDSFYDHSRDD